MAEPGAKSLTGVSEPSFHCTVMLCRWDASDTEKGTEIPASPDTEKVSGKVMVGPVARQCAQNFFVNKLFIGADGFRKENGFTGNDLLRAETVRDMAGQADQVIVLTESSKFSRQGVVTLLPTKQVSIVQTDDAIPLEIEVFLMNQGVDVRKVPGEE